MNNRSWLLTSMVLGLSIAGVQLASGHPHPTKPAPAKPASARLTPKAPASPARTVAALESGPAQVTAEHVNLRAHADIDSEPVGRLNRNDSVRVLEEVVISKPGPGEPSRWAKIAWPAGTPVWVFADFLDKSSSTVKALKLNLRSGPGENHAVVGTLEKGSAVKKLESKGDWWKVEAPEGCAAYVAANLLRSKPADSVAIIHDKGSPATLVIPAIVPSARPPMAAVRPFPNVPPPNARPLPPVGVENWTSTQLEDGAIHRNVPPLNSQTAPPPQPPAIPRSISPPFGGGVASVPPTVPKPAPVAVVEPIQPVVTPAPVAVASPTPLLTRAPGEVDLRLIREDAFVKRIVTREGRVRRSYNIQSPTDMILENLHNGRVMNYLYSTSTNLNLTSYRGRVVTVVGEEALDERWPNIPVIRVETLQTAP